jgi:hypothetical protein
MCLTCGCRDAGRMLRVLENTAAVYVWLAVTLAGVATMLVVGDARVFIIGWAAGWLVATVWADVRARRRR